MNTIVQDQASEIEAFCTGVQNAYADLARPITEDDARYAELGPGREQFTPEELGELNASRALRDAEFPVPAFIQVPAWATRTRCAIGTYPEVIFSITASFGDGWTAVEASSDVTIFVDDFENPDGTVDRRGTIYDDSDKISIILPEEPHGRSATVADLVQVQANVNALVDHLRAHGVDLRTGEARKLEPGQRFIRGDYFFGQAPVVGELLPVVHLEETGDERVLRNTNAVPGEAWTSEDGTLHCKHLGMFEVLHYDPIANEVFVLGPVGVSV